MRKDEERAFAGEFRGVVPGRVEQEERCDGDAEPEQPGEEDLFEAEAEVVETARAVYALPEEEPGDEKEADCADLQGAKLACMKRELLPPGISTSEMQCMATIETMHQKRTLSTKT